MNLGSYNYLGFAQSSGPCATASANAVTRYGCATASTGKELGVHFSNSIFLYPIKLKKGVGRAGAQRCDQRVTSLRLGAINTEMKKKKLGKTKLN